MKAEKIMLIRHGEKPPAAPAQPPPYGVDENGNQDKCSLIVRGWQRAGALIPFFARPWLPQIAVPSLIYAAHPSDRDAPAVGAIPSVHRHARPRQTVVALAAYLNVELLDAFVVGDENALIADLAQREGVVLVCWEHRHIPEIAQAICPQAPEKWDEARFDVVWLFDRAGDDYTFSSVNQGLLPGDA